MTQMRVAEISDSDSELGEPVSCHSVLLSVCCTDALYCVCMHKLCVCVGDDLILGSDTRLFVSVTSSKQRAYTG